MWWLLTISNGPTLTNLKKFILDNIDNEQKMSIDQFNKMICYTRLIK